MCRVLSTAGLAAELRMTKGSLHPLAGPLAGAGAVEVDSPAEVCTVGCMHLLPSLTRFQVWTETKAQGGYLTW